MRLLLIAVTLLIGRGSKKSAGSPPGSKLIPTNPTTVSRRVLSPKFQKDSAGSEAKMQNLGRRHSVSDVEAGSESGQTNVNPDTTPRLSQPQHRSNRYSALLESTSAQRKQLYLHQKALLSALQVELAQKHHGIWDKHWEPNYSTPVFAKIAVESLRLAEQFRLHTRKFINFEMDCEEYRVEEVQGGRNDEMQVCRTDVMSPLAEASTHATHAAPKEHLEHEHAVAETQSRVSEHQINPQRRMVPLGSSDETDFAETPSIAKAIGAQSVSNGTKTSSNEDQTKGELDEKEMDSIMIELERFARSVADPQTLASASSTCSMQREGKSLLSDFQQTNVIVRVHVCDGQDPEPWALRVHV